MTLAVDDELFLERGKTRDGGHVTRVDVFFVKPFGKGRDRPDESRSPGCRPTSSGWRRIGPSIGRLQKDGAPVIHLAADGCHWHPALPK